MSDLTNIAELLSELDAKDARIAELEAALAAKNERLLSPDEDHPDEWWCPLCQDWYPGSHVSHEERHELCGCPVLPDNPHHRSDKAEAALAERTTQRDEANTSTINQRRTFEIALEGRDRMLDLAVRTIVGMGSEIDNPADILANLCKLARAEEGRNAT